MLNRPVFDNNFKEFSAKDIVENAIVSIFKKEKYLLINNNYFVSSKKYLNENNIKVIKDNNVFTIGASYSILSDPILEKNALVLGKINTVGLTKIADVDPKDKIILFRNHLISEEVNWLEIFLKCIYEHLRNRESEGRILTNHGSIRLLVSEIIGNLESIACTDAESQRNYIKNSIRNACDGLAKLTGGRAFLQGSVIEMLWIFEIINNVYFS